MSVSYWHSPLHAYVADPNLAIMRDPTRPGTPLRWFLYGTDDGYPDWGSDHFSVYVSDDLVTWQDGGHVLSLDSIPWQKGVSGCWAPTVLCHDGTYYLYFVCDGQIGVARSGSPYGPFLAAPDPIIAHGQFPGYPIDPAILRLDAVSDSSLGPGLDDGGSSTESTDWLIWGNTVAAMCPLSDDRMRLATRRTDSCAFGVPVPISWTPEGFREALWVFKRKGIYYASWSENDTRDPSYRVRYATAPRLEGPWTIRGVLVQAHPGTGILATGHHSIVSVPGTDEWIIAYHCFDAMTGDGVHRQTLFAPLRFHADGLIEPVVPSDAPYRKTIPATVPAA